MRGSRRSLLIHQWTRLPRRPARRSAMGELVDGSADGVGNVTGSVRTNESVGVGDGVAITIAGVGVAAGVGCGVARGAGVGVGLGVGFVGLGVGVGAGPTTSDGRSRTAVRGNTRLSAARMTTA